MIQQYRPPKRGQSTMAERHAFWCAVIKDYQCSRQKRRDFCRRHGLNIDDFRRWHYRLKHKVAGETEHAKPSGDSGDSQPQSFIRVKAAEPDAGENKVSCHDHVSDSVDEHLRLALGNQREIIIPPQFDAGTLRRLVQTLEGL